MTLDEKRVLVREHLLIMRAESLARAAKHYSFANYVEHRAATVDTFPEVELDLMLADYAAGDGADEAWRAAARHSRDVRMVVLGLPPLPKDAVTIWTKDGAGE